MRNPVLSLLSLLLLFCIAISSATAQTQVQRGVVRMITRTANDPIVPVQGVQVVVGNVASRASDARGRVSLNIAKNRTSSFQLTGVKLPKGSTLILASPAKGKTLYLSPDDLAITFTTPEDKKAVSLATYRKLLKAYDAKAQQLVALRTQLDSQRTKFQANSAAAVQLKGRIDSIQSLINEYFDDKKRDNTLKELQRIAADLALTDYQSLDTLERHIYDLKQAGEWETISTLLHNLMHGNAAAWLGALASRADRAEHDFQFGMARFKDAIEAFKMQHLNDSVAHYYEILARADSTNCEVLNNAAYFELTYMARYDRARTYIEQSLRHAEQDTLKATCYEILGGIYTYKGDYARTEQLYQKAFDLRKQALGENDPVLAYSYGNAGMLYYQLAQYDRAEEYIRKALTLWSSTANEKSADVGMLYDYLGMIDHDRGNPSQAENYYNKALQIRRDALGEESADVATSYNNLAVLYDDQGDTLRAKYYNISALLIRRKVLGQMHPATASSYVNLGSVYEEEGDYRRATAYLIRGLDIQRAIYGDVHPDIATTYLHLGNVAYAQKNYATAESFYLYAYNIQLTTLGSKNPAVATSCDNLANLYMQLQDTIKAGAFYNIELNILVETFGEKSPNLFVTYCNLAVFYGDIGDLDKAEDYAQKALDIAAAHPGTFDDNVEDLQQLLDQIHQYQEQLRRE